MRLYDKSMSINMRVERITGRGGPCRALRFGGSAQWIGTDAAFLIGLEGQVKFRDRVISESARVEQIVWPDGFSSSLNRTRSFTVHLSAPISNLAIQFVEANRGQGDVPLEVALTYQWRDDHTVYWETSAAQLRPIPRSDWLTLLHEIEWSETEIFEVVRTPFVGNRSLEVSLALLRDAENALRNGDYRGVLAKCREALESAAKHSAESDDIRAGFSLLLQEAFPESPVKQDAVNGFIRAFSTLAHLGRHAQYPALHISREEAEFIFTTSLGFFAMVSRRLSKPENR
jgi:hypothetical protein